MRDLSGRLANRVQMTSDGHKAYLSAVERHFGNDIDYAMLVKHYGPAPEQSAARRYSPAECVGTTVAPAHEQENAAVMLRRFESGQAYVDNDRKPVAGIDPKATEGEKEQFDAEELLSLAQKLIGASRAAVQ